MIRTFTLSILTVILLGSCANKFSIVKRKYTGGYYIASSKGHATHKTPTIPPAKLLKQNTLEVEVSNVAVSPHDKAPTVPNTAVKSELPAFSPPLKKEIPAKIITASAKANINPGHRAVKFKALNLSLKTIGLNSTSKDSDATLLVLVILCFLWWLNLIAVYVHDGHKITTNFWVTLLLDFTVIGGVIFSLLVVLDAVDLS